MLTLERAKKVLGSLSKGISDEEILEDVEAAELFKSLFFEIRNSKKMCNNADNEKTESCNLYSSI